SSVAQVPRARVAPAAQHASGAVIQGQVVGRVRLGAVPWAGVAMDCDVGFDRGLRDRGPGPGVLRPLLGSASRAARLFAERAASETLGRGSGHALRSSAHSSQALPFTVTFTTT